MVPASVATFGPADPPAFESASHRHPEHSEPLETRSTESSARTSLAGRRVSSMPFNPRSASPRSIDCSIDMKVMLTKRGVRPRARAIRSAISTSKPTTRSGTCGSASTYGAPPSGSPAQTSSRAWAFPCRRNPKVARIIASVSVRGLEQDNIVRRAQSRPVGPQCVIAYNTMLTPTA